MYPGIFSKTFEADNIDAVFSQVRRSGFRAVQFNFSSAGLPSLPDAIPEQIISEIAAARARHGIRLEAISATFNLTHPDKAVVRSGLASLSVLARAASALGCPVLTLCTGTLDPEDQWRRHPGNSSPAAWRSMTDAMTVAIRIAAEHNLTLGIEPEVANIVETPAKARQLIDELGGGRLKVIFDPANLFERLESTAAQRRILSEALDLLGPDIVIAHAKDRGPDGSFCTAGTGVIDYPFYISALREAGFDGCVVTHGLSSGEASSVAAMLSTLMGRD